MKKVFAPEAMLFAAGLFLGLLIMIFVLGTAVMAADLVFMTILFSIPTVFTALNSWKECRRNRILAASLPVQKTEEKSAEVTEEQMEDVDEMKKPCPPHKWHFDENGQMLCTKCDRAPQLERNYFNVPHR